jgi:hypothetical protein
MFPYTRILRQALGLVRIHRFLWALSLFLVWSNLSYFLVFTPSNGSRGGQAVSGGINFSEWTAAAYARQIWVSVIGLVLLGLLVWLYVRSKAALIIAIKALLDKQETGYKKAFRASSMFSGRILGIWLITSLITLGILLVLTVPVANLISMHFTERAMLLSLIGIIIFIPLSIVIGFVYTFASLFVVLNDMTIKEAIQASVDLVSRYWLIVVTAAGGIILATVFGFLLSIFAVFVVSIPVVFLAAITYYMGGPNLAEPATIVALCIGFVALVIAHTIVVSFQQTAWTLVFLELVKPKKIEESEQPAVVPEVV